MDRAFCVCVCRVTVCVCGMLMFSDTHLVTTSVCVIVCLSRLWMSASFYLYLYFGAYVWWTQLLVVWLWKGVCMCSCTHAVWGRPCAYVHVYTCSMYVSISVYMQYVYVSISYVYISILIPESMRTHPYNIAIVFAHSMALRGLHVARTYTHTYSWDCEGYI